MNDGNKFYVLQIYEHEKIKAFKAFDNSIKSSGQSTIQYGKGVQPITNLKEFMALRCTLYLVMILSTWNCVFLHLDFFQTFDPSYLVHCQLVLLCENSHICIKRILKFCFSTQVIGPILGIYDFQIVDSSCATEPINLQN